MCEIDAFMCEHAIIHELIADDVEMEFPFHSHGQIFGINGNHLDLPFKQGDGNIKLNVFWPWFE